MKYSVIGFKTGKTYFSGAYKELCYQWLNRKVTYGMASCNQGKVYVSLSEPMMVVRA